MRHLELLIDRARELSQNTSYSSNSGVSQRTFVQFFQNAQDFIEREIINAKTKHLLHTGDARAVVSGQEEYSYPSDIFLNGIDTVQWSANGQNWIPLDKVNALERTTRSNGFPYGYFLQNESYVVTPPLSSGYLREIYNKQRKRLEKRSGKITAVTGTPITSLTLDAVFAGHDPTYLDQFAAITIVGRDGRPKVASMGITGVSGITVTVDSYTLLSGEAVAVGDFVLAEGNSTNLPELPDTVESFLIKYAEYQAKHGDSSQWSKETMDDVARHANQIITSFQTMSEDNSQIPITNFDYLEI